VRHAATVYAVRRGDTLFSIAKHFGTSVEALKAQNGLGSTALSLGQRLTLPSTLLAISQPSTVKGRGH
jgi:LysM repeat protein